MGMVAHSTYETKSFSDTLTRWDVLVKFGFFEDLTTEIFLCMIPPYEIL